MGISRGKKRERAFGHNLVLSTRLTRCLVPVTLSRVHKRIGDRAAMEDGRQAAPTFVDLWHNHVATASRAQHRHGQHASGTKRLGFGASRKVRTCSVLVRGKSSVRATQAAALSQSMVLEPETKVRKNDLHHSYALARQCTN